MSRLLRLALVLSAVTLAGCAGGWRNGAPPWERAGGPGAAPAAGSAATTFTWRGEGASVALAGDFNAWSTSADPMAKQADGSWTLTKALAPGKWAYKFVIDGGTWKTDPNATVTADDGYGGKNSVVVVEGAAMAAPAMNAPAAGTAATSASTGKPAPPAIGPDGVTFTYAGAARTVGLAGDFNAWSTTADPMTRQADGAWKITKKLDPGTHVYKFIVDGSTWKQDSANPDVQDDGFGGKNSVVTVK